MSVTSNENKQMLLELMSTIISDNKLIQPDNLREFIEEKCIYFHTRRFEFGSNNDINKKIVELCYNHIMATTRSHKTTTSPNFEASWIKAMCPLCIGSNPPLINTNLSIFISPALRIK